MQEILNHAYRNAKKRLFLLDYDGTLADLKPTPPEAVPTEELKAVLSRLANDPENTVVIVSGRPHETLQEWLGDLPLSFAAEHGFLIREKGTDWKPSIDVDDSWKPEVRSIMQPSIDKINGSILEEKENALAWHCRAADEPGVADIEQAALLELLEPVAERLKLRIINGSKVIEVQPQGISKGEAAKHWLDEGGYDFVLGAGDDTTDEDLLKAVPETGFTVRVGTGESVAKIRAAAPTNFLKLLDSLPA
jgi:trehalose 6-phosphate synthase/phosphatase